MLIGMKMNHVFGLSPNKIDSEKSPMIEICEASPVHCRSFEASERTGDCLLPSNWKDLLSLVVTLEVMRSWIQNVSLSFAFIGRKFLRFFS